MNKSLTLLFPLCCLLAACPSTPPAKSARLDCPDGPAADICPPGLEYRNKVTIRVTPGNIQVTPPVVCADRGGTIEATIEIANGVPDEDEVVVATVPKNAVNGWILSQGTGDGNTFEIKVPGSIDYDFYGYYAMASTGKCLDPMIRVDRN
jgi:hypothetical protein